MLIANDDHLIVCEKSTERKIPCRDIAAIHCEHSLTLVHTVRESIPTSIPFKTYLRVLDKKHFVRINRSSLINLHCIEQINKKEQKVLLSNKMVLDISRRNVKKQLDSWHQLILA